jgi:hypothetical protein
VIEADVKSQTAYTLTTVAEAAPYTGENLLYGSDVATTTTAPTDSYFYKACYGPAGTSLGNWFGWYPANKAKGAFRSEAHRAWLAIPKTMMTRSYYSLGEDVTDIADVVDAEGETWYDLQGRKLSNSKWSNSKLSNSKWSNSQIKKGVYIRNRRKAIVK